MTPGMTATRTDPPAKRMLVVKLSSLGDTLHALPAVAELRDHLGFSVDWAVQPEFADVVGSFSCVDRVLPVPRPSRLREWFSAVAALRRGPRYDMVVDMQGLLKSALVARAARRAPGARLIGPSFAREGSRLFYGELAGRRDKQRHAIDENFDVLRHLGVPVPEEPRFPMRLPTIDLPALEAECGLSPAASGMADGAAAPLRIAVAPFSRWPSKNWPPERFSEAIAMVERRLGARVLVLGGPGDRDGASLMIGAAGVSAANLCGRLSVPESAAVLSRCAVLLTNDSGPMHIAAALGVPCVAPFGPTAADRTGPFGAIHSVLRAAPQVCLRAPCRKRVCPLGTGICMSSVTAEEAFRAMEDAVVRRARPKPSAAGAGEGGVGP